MRQFKEVIIRMQPGNSKGRVCKEMIPGIWQESSGYSVRREFMRSRTLEANHALGLLVAVGDVVRVVAHVLLRGVGQTLVARGLVSHSMGTLRK